MSINIFLGWLAILIVWHSGLSQSDKLFSEEQAIKFKSLTSCVDVQMQDQLYQELNKNLEWKKLINQNRLAVGLVDLSKPQAAKFARINGRQMMYAASLPKIAILLASMDAIDKGELILTKEIDEDLHNMISVSSNQASTRMIDRIGYEKIANVLQDPKYALYDRRNQGGLWVGKRYAAAGPRNPDPIKGLSHAASVTQVCRFYYMMAHGKLINAEMSAKMMEYMVDPSIHHKFVNQLDKLAPDATVYRKSGSWKQYHADSVFVIGNQWRKYILVAMVESENGEQIIRNILPLAEKILKMNQVQNSVSKE